MNKSEKYWDKTASKYDQFEMKDKQTYIHIINRTKIYLKISDMVLDFGSGTGLISNDIAEDVKLIHAIDISSNMIGIAEKKAKERNIQNIHYAHSTIFDERLRKGSFDVILVFHVLHLLQDERIALRRMHKLLKPGGVLISATPCVGEKIFLRSILYCVGRVGLVPHIRSFKLNQLVNTMEEGDFSIVEKDCLKKSSQEYFIVARKI